MNKKARILLVEDDTNLGIIIQDFLEMNEYKVELAIDGEAGWSKFKNNEFDLCILDVMMPKKDGFTLAIEIRNHNKNIPIIFLTARSQKDDRIQGFKTGADDYITKPFSTEELLLRIEAILRRFSYQFREISIKEDSYSIGSYIFNYTELSLVFNSDEIQMLTKKEADLLRFFCHNKNKVITREQILKAIWGNDDYFAGRSMDVFITRLRKYLKKDNTISIANIHGTGFKLIIE